MSGDGLVRCAWCGADPLYVDYHDREWGVPNRDERHLFEMLTLEGAQAGLSWLTILRKREGYRRAFLGFDPVAIARFDKVRVTELLAEPGIVRNRLKVESAVSNARALLDLYEQGDTLANLLWSFVDQVPRHNAWTSLAQVRGLDAGHADQVQNGHGGQASEHQLNGIATALVQLGHCCRLLCKIVGLFWTRRPNVRGLFRILHQARAELHPCLRQ